jgi:hypothetical protein
MSAAAMGEGAPEGSEMDLERVKPPELSSQLEECYAIAGNLATCEFTRTEDGCSNKEHCNEDLTHTPLELVVEGEEDDEMRRRLSAVVGSWTSLYLKDKTETCVQQPRPVVYFGCCHCNGATDTKDHANVKDCENKCEAKDKAFQLFSDGTIKIRNCNWSHNKNKWTQIPPGGGDFKYLKGMKTKGVSKGPGHYGESGIEITFTASKVALKLGDVTNDKTGEGGLVIGCSRGTENSDTHRTYAQKEDPSEDVRFMGDEFGQWFAPMDKTACIAKIKKLYDDELGPKQSRAAVCTLPGPPLLLHENLTFTGTFSSCSHLPLLTNPLPTLVRRTSSLRTRRARKSLARLPPLRMP